MTVDDCAHLTFERRANGVVVMWLDRPDALNAMNARMHAELAGIWPLLDADPSVRVIVVAGRGRAFSAGAELELVEANATDASARDRALAETRALVYNLAQLDKIVISAIHGVAIGAGLAVALLADISVAATNARLMDGHTRIGVVAGDHAALVWPLLVGMAKAKLHLLVSDFVSGAEAERMGLVSLAVPPDQVLPRALTLADRLAVGPQPALRRTKRVLNQWLLQNSAIFDQSAALEALSFAEPDAREGIAALRERRPPSFPSAR